MKSLAALLLSIFFLLVFVSVPTTGAKEDEKSPPAEAPVLWSRVIAKSTCSPALVKGSDGSLNLVYELEISNYRNDPVLIKQILVQDQSGTALLKLSGKNLKKVFTCIQAPHERIKLKPGESAITWVNIVLPEKPSQLSTLNHVIFSKDKKGKSKDYFSLAVSQKKPLVISSPLLGERWLAMGGYNGKLGHRRALMPIGNNLVNAQRYAIDWIKFDDRWKTWHGPFKNEKNSVCYGEPILAVDSGEIVGIIDQFKDQPPFEEGKDMNFPGGNCITLKMDNGFYAFYAHLKPDSLKVSRGQKVKKGQLLALLGNSGHSFEPHLHFHITDKPEILQGNGIPYVIDKFKYVGEAKDLKRYATNKARKEPAPVKKAKSIKTRNAELPSEGAIVTFETE